MPVKNYIDLPYPQLDKLLQELDATGREVLAALSAFNNNNFNKVPFAGSWTGGQVAEHLLKSIEGIPSLITGNTAPTVGRAPDAEVKGIEDIFLDFDIKMQSPEFILPGDGPHDVKALLQTYRATIDSIAEKARTLDLSLSCMDFEFPQVGHLTRWEWISFGICHTVRHARQLRHIHQHLTAVPA
ncbi:DinB family protein [Paraflavitalea pollutisoli]|uniref:DinB family protein n=1 Tax=Paraflavitalea pollutisoli TaxID=3034143 RepID=UPI0023ECE797|nr:DinB family protein [Paraflavitalea sp. H1-2-19X]